MPSRSRTAAPATSVKADLVVAPNTPWERRPKVVQLTQQVLRLSAVTAATVVTSLIAIGEAMAEIRDALPHGQWERWRDQAVPFSAQTIANYMALARWAETRPGEVQRLSPLGPSKLYLIIPLSTPVRRRLLRRRTHELADGTRKSLELLTVTQLARVIAEENEALPERRALPISRVVSQVRRRVAGLDALTSDLAERCDEVEAEDARELHAELMRVAATLESAFDV